MKIERTLFWFKNGNELLPTISEDFFGLGILLNRLLNENYDGKKIKFINFYFSTNRTYSLFPEIPKNKPYYYGGHLSYYGSFDIEEFCELSKAKQNEFLWCKAHEYLMQSAELMKNIPLLHAAKYAFEKGINLNYNTDYRVLATNINLSGQELKASILIVFGDNEMRSKFILERGTEVLFEKDIDKAKNGNEFFLEIYKAIELDNEFIVIKGKKSIEYLPLKIPVKEFRLVDLNF